MTQEQPPRRGRPPSPRGLGVHLPPRMLGRVSDEDWEAIKQGAREAGKPFTHWAVEVLLAAAKGVTTREAGGQVGKE